MQIRKYLATALILIAMIGSASAATYYLDAVNGNDSNPGTSGLPWKTLGKSQTEVLSGDTVILRSGSYGSYEEVKVSRSDWITYRAADGEEPHFDKIRINGYDAAHNIYESYLKFDGIIIDGSDDGIWVSTLEVRYLKFHNMEIVGNGYKYPSFDPNSDNTKGFFFAGSSDIDVYNCYIHGNGNSLAESWPEITPHENAPVDTDAGNFGQGFNWGVYAYPGGSNITIRNCHIEQCQVGMALAQATNSIIENNHVHHCTDDGINLGEGIENSTGEQTVIANNHIHDIVSFVNPNIGGHNDGIQLQGISGTSWVDYKNIIISGNQIHHIMDQGMWLRVGGLSNNWLLENNLVYDTPSGASPSVTLKILSVKNLTFRNNTVDGFLDIGPEQGDTPTINSFTGNIVEQLNIWTDNGDVTLTYENDNIINRTWLQMSEHVFSENSIILNDYTAFQALFADQPAGDYRPVMSKQACNGDVNPPGIAVGALPCLGCTDNNPISMFVFNQKDRYDTEIEFDASDSLACDTTITNHEWDFGDGQTGTGKNITHTYEPGAYTVNLTVTNNLGNTNSFEKSIVILPSLEPGLSLYLNFNNNVIDLSGKGNDGVWNGEPSYGEGQVNQGASFDGTSDGSYLFVDNDESLEFTDSFTLMGWAKKNDPDSGQGLFYKHTLYSLLIADNQIRYRLEDGTEDTGNVWVQAADIYNTDWHHYALAYNGSNVKLYLDGEEIDSRPFSGSFYPVYWDLYFAKNPWGVSFNGSIDEVMVYNRGLNADEIKTVYNAQKLITECIETPALLNYISQWKQGSLSMLSLMQKIEKWKTGEGCSD